MSYRPQDSLNRFYKKLNIDKETRELLKFYLNWKKSAQSILNKRNSK